MVRSEVGELEPASAVAGAIGLGYVAIDQSDLRGNIIEHRGWIIGLRDYKGEADDPVTPSTK